MSVVMLTAEDRNDKCSHILGRVNSHLLKAWFRIDALFNQVRGGVA